MSKKWILIALLTLVLALMTACGDADNADAKKENDNANDNSGGDSVTISLGHSLADSEESHYQQFAEKFKEVAESESDGQISVKIHPNAELGGEREMIETVQTGGSLDAVFPSTAPVGNFSDLINVFDFPFLFEDRDHAYSVLDGEIGEKVAGDLEESGLKVLAWGENGFRNITNSNGPIVKPEDMKGLSIRTMENEVHLDAFKEIGANPTPMSFDEVYTALQQGTVDGQENPLSVIVPNKLYEVQDYFTRSEHVYSAAPLIINKDTFDNLSSDLQDVLKNAAEEARDYERDFIADIEDEQIQILKDNGTEVVPSDEVDVEAFKEAIQPVYEKYDDEYGDILDDIKNAK